MQDVPVVPAPQLTPYELDQLHKIHAWDLTYASSGSLDVAGASGMTTCGPFCTTTVASWSLSHTQRWSYTIQATLRRSAFPDLPCKFPAGTDPCKVSYADGGRVDLTTYAEHLQRTIDYFGGCPPDNQSADHYNDVVDTNASGSYVPDGTPGKSAYDFGVGFGLDASNPPLGKSELGFDAPPGTKTTSVTDCGTTTTTVKSGDVLEFGRLPVGADFYAASQCCEGGDTQVRIDNKGFVITGIADWTTDNSECLFASDMGCPPDQLASGVYHEQDKWTLRPHCDPISESDLNGPNAAAVVDGMSDLDADGIPDCWELNGIQIEKADGTVLTEPLAGASPTHKDLYVEADYMAGHKPTPNTLPDVVAAFAKAPVADLDGTTGVNLHAQLDEQVPDVAQTKFDPANAYSGGVPQGFWAIKLGDGLPCHGSFGTAAERRNPDCADLLAARRLIYRYAIFGDDQAPPAMGSSGVSERGPSNDFMVTLGGWSAGSIAAAGGQEAAEAGTFMHELGHTLGLDHGGDEAHPNCKPNYVSVMNYLYQLPWSNRDPNRPLDYSHGNHPPLNEGSLDESIGIGGPAGDTVPFGLGGLLFTEVAQPGVDWNEDFKVGTVSSDIDRIDQIHDCAGPPFAIDGAVASAVLPNALDPTKIPASAAFTVWVDGVPQHPVRVAVRFDELYLTLATPVAPGASVHVSYDPPPPPAIELTDSAGPLADFDFKLANQTGFRQTLHDYNDWANLQYAFRDTAGFASGVFQLAHPDVPDLTNTEAALLAGPVDTTPPATMATTSPLANAAGWNNHDVTVTLSASDPDGTSDVSQITYSAIGAEPIPQTNARGNSATVTISGEGITRLTYFATDLAGNAETPHTLTVRLDKTPPVVTATPSRPPDSVGWYNHPFTVGWSGFDGVSGVDSCSTPVGYGGPDTPAAEVAGGCTDTAGNTATLRFPFRYDSTPPTVTCVPKPAILWPPDHKLAPVTTTVIVSDPLSGAAGFVLTRITMSEGNPLTDVVGWTVGTSSTSGMLRAERLGTAPEGRVYTLTYLGTDAAGNTTTCSATVTVPHDLRR